MVNVCDSVGGQSQYFTLETLIILYIGALARINYNYPSPSIQAVVGKLLSCILRYPYSFSPGHWGFCGGSVGVLWGFCGGSVGVLWGFCGVSVGVCLATFVTPNLFRVVKAATISHLSFQYYCSF